MPKIQTRCPNCQQPMVADVQQVLDVGVDPEAKQKLLSGMLNLAQCQACGFQGQLPLPLVYHDPENELLLTYYPPSLDKSMEQKESEMGPLIKQVTENLPPEQRKGYLFQPQTMMSMESMIKRVLEEEGVTEDMLQEQQEKMRLLERLLTLTGEKQVALIQQEEDRIDREFFTIFSQVVQRLLSSQDRSVLEKAQELQENLLQETEVGRSIARESEEIEEARKSLEAIGEGLTRAKLLDLVIKAPSEERVKALTSLARPAMDYEFLQMFTEKVEQAKGEERQKLVERRNLILQYTEEIDQYLEERMQGAREVLDKILAEEDAQQGVVKHAGQIDDVFLQTISSELEKAQQAGNQARLEKLQKVVEVIQDMSTPQEYRLIDELVGAADDPQAIQKMVDEIVAERGEDVIKQIQNYLMNMINSIEQSKESLTGDEKKSQEELLDKLGKVHKVILKKSMQDSFRK